jgi:hypothetical protein
MTELACALQTVFRFQSDVFKIDLSGSYTVGSTSIRASEMGGLQTEQLRFAADVKMSCYALRLATECCYPRLLREGGGWMADFRTSRQPGFFVNPLVKSLASPRYVVTACESQEFDQRVASLLHQFTEVRDSGSIIGGLDVDALATNELATAQVRARQRTTMANQAIERQQRSLDDQSPAISQSVTAPPPRIEEGQRDAQSPMSVAKGEQVLKDVARRVFARGKASKEDRASLHEIVKEYGIPLDRAQAIIDRVRAELR